MMRRVTLVVVLVLLAAGCGIDVPAGMEPLPKPDDVQLETPATVVERELSDVDLRGVRGSTTTRVVLGPGPLTMTGKVEGPDGVVAGATVRVERVVEGQSAVADLVTGADGSWQLPQVLGGRYRIRAWLAPSFAMERARVFFVGTSLTDPIVLRVDRFQGRSVVEAIAPNPPPVGASSNLQVRVTNQVVTEDGRVTSSPAAGVQASLAGTGQWQVESEPTTFTGDDGVASWTLRCMATGSQQLSVVLDGIETVPLKLGGCYDRTATTTTSTVPSGSSSTTSPSATTSTTGRAGTVR